TRSRPPASRFASEALVRARRRRDAPRRGARLQCCARGAPLRGRGAPQLALATSASARAMTRSTADTIVVGGGLIGCALAAELRERGQSVLVVERGEPGAEASSAAAGLLSPQSDARARDALFELGAESL